MSLAPQFLNARLFVLWATGCGLAGCGAPQDESSQTASPQAKTPIAKQTAPALPPSAPVSAPQPAPTKSKLLERWPEEEATLHVSQRDVVQGMARQIQNATSFSELATTQSVIAHIQNHGEWPQDFVLAARARNMVLPDAPTVQVQNSIHPLGIALSNQRTLLSDPEMHELMRQRVIEEQNTWIYAALQNL